MFSEFLKLSSFYILSRQIFKIIILQFHNRKQDEIYFNNRETIMQLHPSLLKFLKSLFHDLQFSGSPDSKWRKQLERTPMAINLFHTSHFQI